jgi:hypothetical protein
VVLTCVAGYELPGCGTHDRTLGDLENRWGKLRHPPGTEQITVRSELGLLLGNGNKCDYFVGEARSTSETKETIRAHYAREAQRAPGRFKEYDLRVTFFDEEEDPLFGFFLPAGLTRPGDWGISGEGLDDSYVVSVLWSGLGTAGYDPRCH